MYGLVSGWVGSCQITKNGINLDLIEKMHHEQSSQAGSLLSENPLKSHNLASMKVLIQRNSDDIITCPKICKLLHWL